MNEKRFEPLNLLPEISTKNKINSCNLSFDKQLSREQYHEAFIRKMEEHKVDANAYNAKFS